MNYDDQFNKDFEEKFQKNLAEVRKFQENTDISDLNDKITNVSILMDDLLNKPNKSPEDYEFLNKATVSLEELRQKFQDIQLILNESLMRKARAYYENVKKLAKEGNKEAERIYNDLKNDFEKFDVN